VWENVAVTAPPSTAFQRVAVSGLRLVLDVGRFPITQVIGERLVVQADILADGHEALSCRLMLRRGSEPDWHEPPLVALGIDRWPAEFVASQSYGYRLPGAIDPILSISEADDCLALGVSLDLHHGSCGWTRLHRRALGPEADAALQVHDLLGSQLYNGRGEGHFVPLDAGVTPVQLRQELRRPHSETDSGRHQ